MDGGHGRFEGDDRAGAVQWRDLGSRFRWVLLTITLNDCVMQMGPITRRMDEAGCVLPIREFVRVVENPSPEYAFEVSIGYPFIDYAPIRNFFGFGPGKFGIAVKLFSFLPDPQQPDPRAGRVRRRSARAEGLRLLRCGSRLRRRRRAEARQPRIDRSPTAARRDGHEHARAALPRPPEADGRGVANLEAVAGRIGTGRRDA
jgi:hypothetical protein